MAFPVLPCSPQSSPDETEGGGYPRWQLASSPGTDFLKRRQRLLHALLSMLSSMNFFQHATRFHVRLQLVVSKGPTFELANPISTWMRSVGPSREEALACLCAEQRSIDPALWRKSRFIGILLIDRNSMSCDVEVSNNRIDVILIKHNSRSPFFD